MNPTKPSLQKIPVYEVRLVQSRRPLRLAETVLTDPRTGARALHALIALTDREHFAALFVNGNQQVTGAHIVAIGAQHRIASVDVRAIFRAALAACAHAIVLGHYVPRNIMALLFPARLCAGGRSGQHLLHAAYAGSPHNESPRSIIDPPGGSGGSMFAGNHRRGPSRP